MPPPVELLALLLLMLCDDVVRLGRPLAVEGRGREPSAVVERFLDDEDFDGVIDFDGGPM